jgi:excisionase family DNA binding protein
LARILSPAALAEVADVVTGDIHRDAEAARWAGRPAPDPGAKFELRDAVICIARGRSGAQLRPLSGGAVGELVSIEDAERRTATPSRTLRRWAASGAVTATKVGRGWRLSIRDVERMVEERR